MLCLSTDNTFRPWCLSSRPDIDFVNIDHAQKCYHIISVHLNCGNFPAFILFQAYFNIRLPQVPQEIWRLVTPARKANEISQINLGLSQHWYYAFRRKGLKRTMKQSFSSIPPTIHSLISNIYGIHKSLFVNSIDLRKWSSLLRNWDDYHEEMQTKVGMQ